MEFDKYQEISKKYKEIIDAITNLQLPQLKLYLQKEEHKIINKNNDFYAEFTSLKNYLDTIKEAKGKVPLHYAVARGDIGVVRYLIENVKLDYHVKDKEGNNLFFTAVQHGNLPMTQYFVEELQFSVHATKDGEITALHIVSNHNHVDVLEYLISKGADLQKISIYGKPINWAVGAHSIQATKILLNHNANPDGDSTGTTLAPLILAVDFNLTEIYQLLMEKGANVNAKDPNGYSALHVAAEKGQLNIVIDLIQRGAITNLQVQGKTPLYLAFQHQKWNIVNYLKEREPNYEQIQKEITENLNKKIKNQENKVQAEEIKVIGNKMYGQKKYEEALIEYQKALQYDNQNEVLHRNIAACYLALQKYQQALFHCHYARRKDNKNVKTIYRESQANVGLKNLIDASANLWECCMLEPANTYFKMEFHKCVEEAKKQHKQNV